MRPLTQLETESAITILHNLALERKRAGWWSARRWYINSEPLRNDAARWLIWCWDK